MVVYQIYPRSFQDSDGDGVGDLNGVRARLDHLAWLGVDALWLSPIYPSPMPTSATTWPTTRAWTRSSATLEDFDALAREARQRGLDVLLDIVPCHTSIEHPWFREHPDWYIWADAAQQLVLGLRRLRLGALDGRYYLHSFYPEQPDLDWRNPEVVAAMQDVLRFWLERGAAGYRIDAIDRLMKDPELRDDPPASEPFGLPLRADEASLALTNSRNAPGTGEALAADPRRLRATRSWWGRCTCRARAGSRTSSISTRVFAFELLHAPWEAGALRRGDRGLHAGAAAAAWVMSNHDFGRLGHPLRRRERARGGAAAAHAPRARLPLPGRRDRPARRAAARARASTGPGATAIAIRCSGTARPAAGSRPASPGCRSVDPAERNVAAQREDPGSTLTLVRDADRACAASWAASSS